MNKILNLVKIVLVAWLLQNCQSAKQMNKHIDSEISVKRLHKDVDFVHKKIFKLHPDLDRYITKEKLAFKFDSLKKSIQQPLKPNAFFFGISQVVGSIRQGHATIQPLQKQYSTKELKILNKRGKSPLSLLSYAFVNEELLIAKNYGKDSTLKVGTVIKSVAGITPQFLYTKYRKTEASDGYNTTYFQRGFARKFNTLLNLERPMADSIPIVFSYKDSIFEKTLTRTSEKAKAKKKSDKETKVAPVVVSKEAKEKQLLAKKALEKKKKIFGYDEVRKEFTRHLSYIPSDSSIAVLKIKSFTGGKEKVAYAHIFKEIEQKKVKSLVIDLRNNGGGSLPEIINLYRYIGQDFTTFVDTMKVTNRTGVVYNRYRNVPKTAMVIASPLITYLAVKEICSIKKSPFGYYYQKSKLTKRIQPRDNNFQGNVYVLINGASFSASAVFSANLKHLKRATFIGEETGGASKSTVAGVLPIMRLPHSKLKLRFGLMEIAVPHKTTVEGHGVYPDITLLTTKEDFEKNSDPELEWVIQKENELKAK